MAKARRKAAALLSGETFLAGKRRREPPHEFVLEALDSLSPMTRHMFGCLGVYVDDKIVLILRDKPGDDVDNGLWLATFAEHHDSLRQLLPNMRRIAILGERMTDWQLLPADEPDFETAARRTCQLILARDPRIGRIPQRRQRREKAAKLRR